MDPPGRPLGVAARGSGQRSRHPGLEAGAELKLALRRVIGAGFALPRDAGRRPAQLLCKCSRRDADSADGPESADSRRRNWRGRLGAPTGRTGPASGRHSGPQGRGRFLAVRLDGAQTWDPQRCKRCLPFPCTDYAERWDSRREGTTSELGVLPAARLRRAVPAGGRRSKPSPPSCCGESSPSCDGEYEKSLLTACGETHVSAETGEAPG